MRSNTKALLCIFLALGSIVGVRSINIDRLIEKANIYYQEPVQNGKAREYPMSSVEKLNSNKNLKVIVHGFLGNRFHDSIRPLRHAYMAQGMDNIFLADWRNAANLDYFSSRNAVGKVGVFFAQLLEGFIRKHKIPLAEVHIIGHSLGAHIAGNIGSYFNGSLGRVTGLDPALPLFTPKSPDSLQPNAATFVDVIHTDFPVFGDMTPRGTADFYPNYGYAPQKGCGDDALLMAIYLELIDSCSHNRAVTLYAESIGQPKSFPSLPCTLGAIRMRKSSSCLRSLSAIEPVSRSVEVYMGEYVPKSASGVYYLETYDAPPYGMGANTRLTKSGK